MTDTYMQTVTQQMNQVMDHALQVQKANDKKLVDPDAPDDPV
jgi:hypothetical protein